MQARLVNLLGQTTMKAETCAHLWEVKVVQPWEVQWVVKSTQASGCQLTRGLLTQVSRQAIPPNLSTFIYALSVMFP